MKEMTSVMSEEYVPGGYLSDSSCVLKDKLKKKVWISPFQNEPLTKENDDILLKTDLDSVKTLKNRPKTPCKMDHVKEDVINGEHEVLVNILNNMETRRLRRVAYPIRCVSACSFEERINDITALNSLYEIYLGQSKSKPDHNGAAVVRFRRISDSELAPLSARNKSSATKNKNNSANNSNKTVNKADSGSTRILKSASGKFKNLKALPITSVEFVREEHIKNVAERRKKCQGMYSKDFKPQYEVKWNKFGLSKPIKTIRDKDFDGGLYFDHVAYELSEPDQNEDSAEVDPYPLASHRNVQHQPGQDYNSTCSSRVQSSKKVATPNIIIQDIDESQDINLVKKSRPDKEKHRHCRKNDVKVNSFMGNDTEEILYQSSSMKEILRKSRPSKQQSDEGKSQLLSESDIKCGANDKNGDRISDLIDSIDSNRVEDTQSSSYDEEPARIHNENGIVLLETTKIDATDSSRVKESKDFVVKRNNFLAPNESSSEINEKVDLKELFSRVEIPTTPKTILELEDNNRSMSAIVAKNSGSLSNYSELKVPNRPKSCSTGTSRRRVRSSKSMKPRMTREDKQREKERKLDLKKLKQLEEAERAKEKSKKVLEDSEKELIEQKRQLEENQNDLLREEEKLKQALDAQKLSLAQERKQKRKEEAEKRRQEVERRREEKRLADLEMARRNAELAAIAKDRQEKAEALQAELKRLEEERKACALKEEQLEKQRQIEREEEEKREIERAKELERLELLRIEEERKKREQVIMAAELKLKMLEEEQKRQKEQQRMEELRIQEERELLIQRENARLVEERKRREEERRIEEENARRKKEEEERKRLALLDRKRENFDQRKGLAFTKHNQRVTKTNNFSYFVQVPRQTWELPIGWQKKPKYKPGGGKKK